MTEIDTPDEGAIKHLRSLMAMKDKELKDTAEVYIIMKE